MNLFACEHPIKIKNPYTNDWLYVPCGKCDMCRSNKSAKWTERLEIERSCHPYCLFGTLTYSDKYLPRFEYLDKDVYDPQSGELVLYDDIKDYVDYFSTSYIDTLGFLPVGKVSDCQRFIKRVRDRVYNNPSSERPECRYIRYFLVCELGETTFRPHYHFLIFTSSKWFAEHAKDVVASCWSVDSRRSDSEELGIIDVQNVQSSASAYVASYINSFTDCPQIYKHPRFRPFKIFSKHPPLGTLTPCSKEIQALFNSGSCKMSVYRRKSNEFVETFIPKSLCDRLYPKVTGFDRFSSDELTRLYSIPVDFSQMSFEDFREFARRRSQDRSNGNQRFFSELFINTTESESNLHHTFSVFRRVSYQSVLFGLSKEVYAKKILDFYKSLDYGRLKAFYQYYEDYSRFHDSKEMLLNDRIYFDLIKSDPECFTNFLKTYGYDEKTCSAQDFVESISEENDINFLSARSKAKKVVNDSRKKKAKNEYLDHRNMNVNFKNLLKLKHGL